MVLVIFWCFLNFGPFFGPFLGTVVENSKNKRVAPGNFFNFAKKNKNPNIDIWVPKMRFSKIYIFGAPIESEDKNPPQMITISVRDLRKYHKNTIKHLKFFFKINFKITPNILST